METEVRHWVGSLLEPSPRALRFDVRCLASRALVEEYQPFAIETGSRWLTYQLSQRSTLRYERLVNDNASLQCQCRRQIRYTTRPTVLPCRNVAFAISTYNVSKGVKSTLPS